MIVKTLRDLLSVYHNCNKVELCMSHGHIDEYFYRTSFKFMPSMVLNGANNENSVFHSYSNKKWTPHYFRAVTYINTDAEVVRIPVYLFFSLIESMYNQHNIDPPVTVRNRQYFETEVHRTELIDLLYDFDVNNIPNMYHCVTLKKRSKNNQDISEAMQKITRAFDQNVTIRGPLDSDLGDAYVAVPENNNEPLELSLNRLKISTGNGSEDITWMICVEENLKVDNFKCIINTLLNQLPDKILDERLLARL